MKAYIVWNEAKNEGIIFKDTGEGGAEHDAYECVNRSFSNPYSSLGSAFARDCYDEDKLTLQIVEIPNDSKDKGPAIITIS